MQLKTQNNIWWWVQIPEGVNVVQYVDYSWTHNVVFVNKKQQQKLHVQPKWMITLSMLKTKHYC